MQAHGQRGRRCLVERHADLVQKAQRALALLRTALACCHETHENHGIARGHADCWPEIMKPFVVLYATREGQTRRIAEHVAATLRARGKTTDVVDVRNLPDWFDLARYGGAVVAASVHAGKHEQEMVGFVKREREALEKVPAAFLSVSLAEAASEDASAAPALRRRAADEARATVAAFLEETGWHPSRVKAVAGAVLYTQYNLVVRLVMKLISKRTNAERSAASGERSAPGAPAPHDPAHDYEYTDWAALDVFVDELLAAADGKPRARAPSASPTPPTR
jgi:menaquinone-dependent protoporphyrinogen oxidase